VAHRGRGKGKTRLRRRRKGKRAVTAVPEGRGRKRGEEEEKGWVWFSRPLFPKEGGKKRALRGRRLKESLSSSSLIPPKKRRKIKGKSQLHLANSEKGKKGPRSLIIFLSLPLQEQWGGERGPRKEVAERDRAC